MEWFWVVGLALLLAIAGAAAWAVRRVRSRVRQLSRTAFGTDSLLEGLSHQQEMLAETPKSVSGMTKILLPQIARDFPAFRFEEFRQKAENTLRSVFAALSEQDVSLLTGASEELRRQVSLRIGDAAARGVRERFLDPKIHRTEITAYRKENGRCSVVLQSAVGFLRFEEEQGRLVSGSRETPVQTRFNTEFVYVQDRFRTEAAQSDRALGLKCPNCGAPITSLGVKVCAYCGTQVEEVNRYAWEIDRYSEAV